MFELYFITDRKLSRKSEEEQVLAAIKGGADAVQYRGKELGEERMLITARRLAKICKKAGVPFIVNDSIQVALKSGADGVHLGQTDSSYEKARKLLGSKKLIGISASTAEQALAAGKAGADYIGLGPIFATSTKKDAAPAGGLGLIRKTRPLISTPLVAIGGITPERAGPVIRAGADGVAAISAILAQDDIASAVAEFKSAVRKAKRT